MKGCVQTTQRVQSAAITAQQHPQKLFWPVKSTQWQNLAIFFPFVTGEVTEDKGKGGIFHAAMKEECREEEG